MCHSHIQHEDRISLTKVLRRCFSLDHVGHFKCRYEARWGDTQSLKANIWFKIRSIECQVQRLTMCTYIEVDFDSGIYHFKIKYTNIASLQLIISITGLGYHYPIRQITMDVDRTWWRHQMETFTALPVICAGNSPVIRWISCTKASDAELWYFLWSAPELTIG